MKKTITILVLVLNYSVSAQILNHTFNYQGELIDNGTPAVGSYDIKVQAFETNNAVNSIGTASTHIGVTLENGLFSVPNVDIGLTSFNGLEMWLLISVKKTSETNYIALSPLQKLQSVPYATTLIDKGATNGQVLTFDNTSGWIPQTPTVFSGDYNDLSNQPTIPDTTGWDMSAADDFSGSYSDLTNKPTIPSASPWTDNTTNVTYQNNVAIGGTNASSHSLTISDTANNKALRLIGDGFYGQHSQLNFGDNNFVYLQEDLDDKLLIFANGRTAIMGGNVGVGVNDPDAKLEVNGQIKITGGLPGANKVLTSDNNGLATWKNNVNTGNYGTVNNPVTGKTWLDRNLGASQVATSDTDSLAYGDLYQWGRGADGHQKRNSANYNGQTTTWITGLSNSTLSKFIIGFDQWFLPPNKIDLWKGTFAENNPCPSGFRVPTISEWFQEMQTWSTQDHDGAFASLLKLPFAGERDDATGGFFNVGSNMKLWSSTPYQSTNPAFANRVYAFSAFYTNANIDSQDTAQGHSIRCIQD